ncbi:MAG: cofactor-independent phosphoglycerate mutase [Candidatus Omnitrophota bacterium]
MKYILIVPDGAADYPIEALGGKTPLEAADTPFMDSLAREGILGRVKTVPEGFTPASDIANLSLLGYDPKIYYSGRGPLEAENIGVKLNEGDCAFRCNLITESEDRLIDYSAGHIPNRESHILMDIINRELKNEKIEFYPGTSYRNLMVYRGGSRMSFDKLKYFAPHDIMGKSIKRHLPSGNNSELVIDLMLKSKSILANHEVNKVRVDLGENPANMIWLWGCGAKVNMPSFEEMFGLRGAVISAVDLIKGIGKTIGFNVIDVPGANGYYDTNYKGKASAALRALEDVDFVFLHIEATDEAGHNNDLRMKMACLERIDKLLVGTIVKKNKAKGLRILITPDHPTPISKRTHTREPVPFLIWGKGIEAGGFSGYSEFQANTSSLYFDSGSELLDYFLKYDLR